EPERRPAPAGMWAREERVPEAPAVSAAPGAGRGPAGGPVARAETPDLQDRTARAARLAVRAAAMTSAARPAVGPGRAEIRAPGERSPSEEVRARTVVWTRGWEVRLVGSGAPGLR